MGAFTQGEVGIDSSASLAIKVAGSPNVKPNTAE